LNLPARLPPDCEEAVRQVIRDLLVKRALRRLAPDNDREGDA
jgi:hypothetical protein